MFQMELQLAYHYIWIQKQDPNAWKTFAYVGYC